MTSLAYDSAVDGMAQGTIVFGADPFAVLLVDDNYVPDKAAHTRRSDVTSEVVGAGYTAGGTSVTVTVATDTTQDQTDITLGAAAWPLSTITAAGAVYFKARGGAASDDELVAYIDFGGDVSSRAGAFSLEASTLRIQN